MAQNEESKDQNKTTPNAKRNNTGVNDGKKEKSRFGKKRIIIPAVIILLFIAGAVYWYIGQIGHVSTDDAFVDANQLSVSSKILGRITRLTVDEGDSVKEGQMLVALDSTDYKARENQAMAMLNLANESITLAKVNIARAQDDFNRAQNQYKDKIIPKEQFDHAQKALEAAQAEYKIDMSKIGTAKAQLQVLKANLQNTKIYSPMEGVVAKRWVLKGDVISPGQPVFTIYNLKNIWITAELEETNLSSIHLGDKVQISVDAYPDQKFEGKVYQIGSTTASEFALIPPSNASGNFTKVTQRVPVKISIKPVLAKGEADPPGSIKLLPGMSVEIDVKVN